MSEEKQEGLVPYLGQDGCYCLWFKTEEVPDFEKFRRLFRPYNTTVRCDPVTHCIFVRSTKKEDILRCYYSFKHLYNFGVAKNSKKKNEKYENKTTSDNSDTLSSSSACDKNFKLLSKKPCTAEHVIFINIPNRFTTEDICDACSDVGVFALLIVIKETKNVNVHYASVYVKNKDDVKKLYDAYKHVSYNRHFVVRRADDLLMATR